MVYQIIMAILALAAILPLLLEPVYPSYHGFFAGLDTTILVIFALDYFWRFYTSKDKKLFFLHNIPDLIAIIPFSKVFRAARLIRLTRLARFSRFTRVFRLTVYGQRLVFRFNSLLRTNGLNYMILATVILIIIGAGLIFAMEYGINPDIKGIEDALWWSLVTTTTVGYGDITPITTLGRVLAGLLMIFGIGFMGMVTAAIATYFLKSEDTKVDLRIDDDFDVMTKLFARTRQLTYEETVELMGYLELIISEKAHNPRTGASAD